MNHHKIVNIIESRNKKIFSHYIICYDKLEGKTNNYLELITSFVIVFQAIAPLKQCFIGKSRIDTPVWYTTDYQYKKYSKLPHSAATVKTSRGM